MYQTVNSLPKNFSDLTDLSRCCFQSKLFFLSKHLLKRGHILIDIKLFKGKKSYVHSGTDRYTISIFEVYVKV